MPVLTFHLGEGQHARDDVRALVAAAGRIYADVLGAPVERVRVSVRTHDPALSWVAGAFADDPTTPVAPIFEFVVLAGRPPEHRTRLLAAFTDLVVEHLGVERAVVRGRATELDPTDWAIGGVPAAEVRSAELAARGGAR